MSIDKINSPSFNGIRKVVSMVLPTKMRNLDTISMSIQKGVCRTVKDGFVPSKKAKPASLIKMTQYFNKDRLVGTHYDFAGGGYMGNRTFADGTQIKYSASRLFGTDTFVAGTKFKREGFIGWGHMSHDAYDKNGRPAVPTLKFIDKLTNPKSIEKQIKEGTLREITNLDF